MAKRYYVDLSSLDNAEKEAAVKQLDSFAFMTTLVRNSNGLSGIIIVWDADENFSTSAALPSGCPWREV